MEVAQLAFFGLVLNGLISVASPYIEKKFGDNSSNVKRMILIIIPIAFAILKLIYGDSFWQSLLMVGGTASYLYSLWTKPQGDPIAFLSKDFIVK
jgi:hypothetical protein